MTGLSLRLRIFLFFALIAVVGVFGYAGGVYFAYLRSGLPSALEPMLQAAAIGSFVLLAVIVAVWLLFDENVARPLIRLANDLRSRAHSEVSSDIQAQSARYLGDIAPAACAMTTTLRDSRNTTGEAVRAHSEQVSRDCRRLAAILRDAPVGLILCNRDHRMVLYNSRAALQFDEAEGAPGLHRSVFDILPERELRDTLTALDAGAQDVALSYRTDAGCAVEVQISPVHADSDEEADGYLLVLHTADRCDALPLPVRRACYDLDLLTTEAGADVGRKPLADLDCIVFDTETTGLNAEKGDEIVQLAAVRIVNGKPVESEVFDTLVDPRRSIPASATTIHGITSEMVREAPTIDTALRDFHAFCRDSVLVAHFAPFDLGFVRKNEAAANVHFDRPVLDTVLLSAIIFGAAEDHSLDALAARLDIDIPAALRHTALGDSIATRDAFRKLIPLLNAKGIVTLKDAIAAENAIRPKLKMPAVVDSHAVKPRRKPVRAQAV